ncbi:MAG: L-serine ammonia-lyase, iron-sulfur-dependent, subunit alpha [Candidatus Gracilibacteria bacterium]|jgi:L-serine dehydratase
MYSFQTAKQLLNLCKKHKMSIGEVAIHYEMSFSGKKREEVIAKMKKTHTVMWDAVSKAIKKPEMSAFNMAGGSAAKLMKALKDKKKLIMPPLVIKAMAYATATGETNSAMGRIVAFPTAGGAGVVPGVLLAAEEECKYSEEKVIKALFTASAIGILIAENATLSAAAGGCQAEVGAAVTMATAALTELRGGTPQQACNAAAMALKSYLALVCDPLGGLVAVPCIKRNMLGASAACAASDASIAGIESFIPLDDVIMAMNNIAKIMSPKLRETALGGLAVTPTGLTIRKKLGLPPLKKNEID